MVSAPLTRRAVRIAPITGMAWVGVSRMHKPEWVLPLPSRLGKEVVDELRATHAGVWIQEAEQSSYECDICVRSTSERGI